MKNHSLSTAKKVKLICNNIFKSNELILGISLGTMIVLVVMITLYAPSPKEKVHNAASSIQEVEQDYQAPEWTYNSSSDNNSNGEIIL